MNITIEKKSETKFQSQIELATELLARLFIQQATINKKCLSDKQIKDIYGKSTK